MTSILYQPVMSTRTGVIQSDHDAFASQAPQEAGLWSQISTMGLGA
jgi:hypothetical protein